MIIESSVIRKVNVQLKLPLIGRIIQHVVIIYDIINNDNILDSGWILTIFKS